MKVANNDPYFTSVVRWRPLVAAVIITAANEEVRRGIAKSQKSE